MEVPVSTTAPKFGLAALLFVLSSVYQGLGVLFMVLVIMSCLDFLTGLISGAILGKLSSRTSLYGIFRKISLLILVPVAVLIDMVLKQTGYTSTSILYTAVTSWLIVTEAISIMENVAKCGGPVPPVLHKVLHIMGGHSEPAKRKTNNRRKTQ